MNRREWRTWATFSACALLVGLALYWVTREALDLERRETAARQEAHLHESMRLALWRMDSALAPILAREAARPATAADWPPPPPHFEAFRQCFSIDATGTPSHPDVAPFFATRFTRLPAPVEKREGRFRRADDEPVQEEEGKERKKDKADETMLALGERSQVAFSNDEYQSRMKMARQATSNRIESVDAARDAAPAPSAEVAAAEVAAAEVLPADALAALRVQTLEPASSPQGGAMFVLDAGAGNEAGPLEARWIAGPAGRLELFFVRTIKNRMSGAETLQGIWCDWNKLERFLVAQSGELFVDCRLEPAPNPTPADHAAMLATLPARFVPGAVTRPALIPPGPTRLILVVAWTAALGAITAVGLVLRAATRLGERRGRFVSAVTHELRTPLTTFRMYSQMLADGMVAPEARPEYLATLKEESERLTRVVESVLLYSRLEEGRGGAHRETVSARELLDRIAPALTKRATDGGMRLDIVADPAAEGLLVVDVQAVEQILLNLVDNACKYARPSDPRLEILWRTAGRKLQVICRDFGPGIPPAERDSVFLPFRRGERHAAGTTPGVGLGLSLASGLAHALGGDLVLVPIRDGARFALTLPLSSA